jgi:hypothetical protein
MRNALKIVSENPKEKDHLGDLEINRMVILKLILKQ